MSHKESGCWLLKVDRIYDNAQRAALPGYFEKAWIVGVMTAASYQKR
jgi:hypothetical protein